MIAHVFAPRFIFFVLSGYAYQIRLAGKRLKARSQVAYYAIKYVLIGGLFYWIFLS